MQEIAEQCGLRVENIYQARGYCCSEAIIVGLNGIFQAGLDETTALRLGSGFCHGMGGAEGDCGALAGAELMLGLLLGPHQEGGLAKKTFRKEVAAAMHDRFRTRFAASGCQVLLKRRKEKIGAGCVELTQGAAEIATQLILVWRPELADRIDHGFLAAREVRSGKA